MERRIAFLHDGFPFGGGERVTSDVGYYLHKHGYKCYIFAHTFHYDKMTDSDKEAFTFVTLPNTKYSSREAVVSIADHINELSIEVFVDPITPLKHIGYLRENTHAKIVFELHSLPYWEADFILISGERKVKLSGSLLKKILWYGTRKPRYKLTGSIHRKIEKRYRLTYNNCDAYTVLCDEYKEILIRKLGLSPTDNHIEVIPNFIRPRHYPAIEKEKEVLYIGRFSYADKRVDQLLEIWSLVWRDFPDWTLRLVGDGDEKENLKKMASELGLENVVFEEFTPDPWKYYQKAPILAVTSMFEGWGLVISEGQQAGAVPVAYDCSAGVRCQITPDGVNGFLIQPGDQAAFADRLRTLMSDDNLREKIQHNVIEKSKDYDMETTCLKWKEMFDKL